MWVHFKVGNNTFQGGLKNHTIHFENDHVNCDVTLEGLAESCRHHTGQIFFNEKKYFAWLPSVPEGKVTADITVDGKKLSLTGSGYHDHNWGNTGMFWLMHHWYWGRTKVGDYQVISSYITAKEEYGCENFPIFVIYKVILILNEAIQLFYVVIPLNQPGIHRDVEAVFTRRKKYGRIRKKVKSVNKDEGKQGTASVCK